MDDMDRSQQPWIFAVLGVLVAGLASFFIWLMRLISKPKKRDLSTPLAVNQFQAENDAGVLYSASPTALNLSTAEGVDTRLTSTKETASQLKAISQPQPASPDTTVNESNPWTAPTRYMTGAGIFLFFLWLINYSKQSLTMLVFAGLIAILVQPAINFLQKRLRFSQGLATITMYLVVTLLVFVLPIVIIPNIAQAISSFLHFDWQGLVKGIAEALNNISAQVSAIPLIGSGLANSFTAFSNAIQNLITSQPTKEVQSVSMTDMLKNIGGQIGFLARLVGPLVSGILSLIFMLLISLQMSLASGEIKSWVTKLFPDHFAGEISALLDQILLAWTSFLRGEFSLMVVMGLVTWILNLLLGTPQALLLGILAGLLEVVPSLGPILATIPAAILAVLFGSSVFPGLNPWIFMLIVISGYVLLQAVENQVLVPRILGGAVSLPSVVVLIGVTIAGAKAGIAGVFLATPIMATGKVLLEYVLRKIKQEPQVTLPPEDDKTSFTDQVRGFIGRIRSRFQRAG